MYDFDQRCVSNRLRVQSMTVVLAGRGQHLLAGDMRSRYHRAMRITTIATALATLAFSTAVQAQWLNERTPGIPRLADGNPNLAAPAPRTADGKPDLSGLWIASPHPAQRLNVAADLRPEEVQPWAKQVFNERMNNFGKDDPASINCQPFGPRDLLGTGAPEAARSKIVQTPALVVILHENLTYRQVFLDGRKLPPAPNPSFMGSSVGRWEGDELIVDSAGFKDGTWLDYGGHPHTEDMHITERYRRVDFGHIERRITLTDAKTFNKPITFASNLTLVPDTELLEFVCAETPPARYNLTGSAEDVRVAPEILAKYVGVYDIVDANPFDFHVLTVSRDGARLVADFDGKGHIPMVPISDTMFSPRLLGTYEFVSDQNGVVTHVLMHGIASTLKAVRRRE